MEAQQQQQLLLAEAAEGLPASRPFPAVQQQQQQHSAKLALILEAVLAAAKAPQSSSNTQLLLQLIDVLSTAVALQQQQQQTASHVFTPAEVEIVFAAAQAVAKQQGLIQQQIHQLQQQQKQQQVRVVAKQPEADEIFQQEQQQQESHAPAFSAAEMAETEPPEAAASQQQHYKPLPIREFVEDVYAGPLLPKHTATALAFGSSSESDSDERRQKKRKRERRVNTAASDALWHPHFHPHNQEFRVRYRYKGSMRLKTLSCSRFGREGAKRLTAAFVARWEATGRRIAERTVRSKLALVDLPDDTNQLPSYGRKHREGSRQQAAGGRRQQQRQVLLPAHELLQQTGGEGLSFCGLDASGAPGLFDGSGGSGGLEEEGGPLAGGRGSSPRGALGGPKEFPRGPSSDLRSVLPCCSSEELAGPSPVSVLTPSCSSLSAKSPASPEQCPPEALEALGGGLFGGPPGSPAEEGLRKLHGLSHKRPRPLAALAREPPYAAAAASGSLKHLSAAAAGDTNTETRALYELGLNVVVLQSLLGQAEGPLSGFASGRGEAGGGGPKGAPRGAAAAAAEAPWAVLAPAAPVTPTTSASRGSGQGGLLEGDLMPRKQQKPQTAYPASQPNLLQQLSTGLPAITDKRHQQQQQEDDEGLKLLCAAAAAQLQRGCFAKELDGFFFEGASAPQKQNKNTKTEKQKDTKADAASEGCDSPPPDLLGEFLFKVPSGEIQENSAKEEKSAAPEFVSFGRL